MMKCTCGQPAIHSREIDGKVYTLCGECNAVLEGIRNNLFGLSVLKAIRIKCDPEDDTFLKLAGSPPMTYSPTDAPPAHTATAKATTNTVIQYDPFFPPLLDNHNEIHREPPEMPDDTPDTTVSGDEGVGVVEDPPGQ